MLNRKGLFGRTRIASWGSLFFILASPLLGQGTERKPDYLVGEATAVDSAARRLTVKSDSGGSVLVTVPEGAAILRTKPGATTLADATPLGLEQIAQGDRVMVRGALSGDKESLVARQVVLMTRDDIAHKQEEDRGQWRRRGVLGVVKAIDPAKGEITLQVGRAASAPVLVIETGGGKVSFRRYAPDSVKFSDARPSALDEVRVDDQLRALGERSPDGTRLVAEQIVFGTFRTVSGTVVAVDAGRSELTLRDEGSGKKLAVAVGPDARVRRLPPEVAARLVRAREEPAKGAREGEPRRPRSQPGAGPEDLLERLPPTTLADLKAGDRILVSSTEGGDAARLNAIAVVAGLEALLPPARPGRPRGADIGLPSDLMDLGMGLP
ncbi:MAG TPA: hypothetical protein VN461_08260 [Vicinamibacteria bacterium]|nr:hypothetical protein [Vicinamibacteria bacterium]